MDIIRKYICPICHKEYDKEEYAYDCMNKGIEKPLVKLGDKIKFKDCEETPILYNKKFTDDILVALSKKENTIYAPKIITECANKISDAGIIDNEIEYEVVGIEKDDHNMLYYLGHNRNPDFTCIDFYTKNSFKYPVIVGNDMMQKVLDLYNGGKHEDENK